MSRRMVSTTVYFEADQVDRLRRLSQATRVPMSTIVRDALEARLREDAAKIPAADADPRQVTVDDYLDGRAVT